MSFFDAIRLRTWKCLLDILLFLLDIRTTIIYSNNNCFERCPTNSELVNVLTICKLIPTRKTISDFRENRKNCLIKRNISDPTNYRKKKENTKNNMEACREFVAVNRNSIQYWNHIQFNRLSKRNWCVFCGQYFPIKSFSTFFFLFCRWKASEIISVRRIYLNFRH